MDFINESLAVIPEGSDKSGNEWMIVADAKQMPNARGQKAANNNILMLLDAAITALEQMRMKVKIGFWHVLREYSEEADGLAKAGAREAQ